MIDLTLPYQSHSTTSQAAAVAAVPSAPTQRLRVYEYLRTNGGATDEQVQDALRMNPSTQRPRRIELVNMGKVIDSTLRNKTKSGRAAVVWVAV